MSVTSASLKSLSILTVIDVKNVSRNYAGNLEEVNEDSVRKYKSSTKIVELKCAKL